MKGCIICRLTAGLGNQLFQYAACKTIALSHDLELFIDTSYFGKGWRFETRRLRYQLSDLGLRENLLSRRLSSLVGIITRFNKGAKLYNFFAQATGLARWVPRVAYDKQSLEVGLLDKNPHLILKGYWQNYPDIDAFSSEIRELFDLRPDPRDARYAELISTTISTAVHVRLGDYVNDPLVARTYTHLSSDYYMSAMDRIRKGSGGRTCHFLIFSNDLERAQEIIGLADDITYVADVNNDIREFQLMTKCDNQIIANSTFSWWAAFMNSNKGKVVVAPMKWFVDEQRSKDIWIPASWCIEVI